MVSFTDLPIRSDLAGRTPYGAPQLHVPVELNVNENTHGIPEDVAADVVSAVSDAVRGLNRYPDRDFIALRTALAGYLGHGLTVEQTWAANGSNEILQQLLQAFGGPGRSALGFMPTYSMYPLLASGTGTAWIAGSRDADFELSAATAAEQVRAAQPDVVILCSPNNPTGTPLGLDVIEAVYDAAPGMVIVDEAYAEYAPEGTATALTLLPGRERLVISRTMSKAFAFAGARLGYLAADAAVVDALQLVRLPYHLSALTQAAATAALGHSDRMLRTVAEIAAQRDRMALRLAELGYRPLRSAANFLLFGGVEDPAALFEALLERGIIIRDVGLPGHLRVTAGTEAETSAFLAAMSDLTPRG